jgi:electron transport complex protein RnfG
MNESTTKAPTPGVTIESPSSLRMILTMGGIGLAAGILIVMTFQLTFPVIKRNKAVALERAIFDVVPGAETKAAFKLAGDELVLLEGEDETATKFYACYDGDRQLVGVAMEASGQGFQDILRVLYGYSPQCGCVVGLKVLESKETPGLGDKIETDPDFRANFEALDAALNAEKTEISNPIVLVKEGKKTDAWQVEAITGATISSRAIASILRESTAVTVPLIAKNLAVLERGIQ